MWWFVNYCFGMFKLIRYILVICVSIRYIYGLVKCVLLLDKCYYLENVVMVILKFNL